MDFANVSQQEQRPGKEFPQKGPLLPSLTAALSAVPTAAHQWGLAEATALVSTCWDNFHPEHSRIVQLFFLSKPSAAFGRHTSFRCLQQSWKRRTSHDSLSLLT